MSITLYLNGKKVKFWGELGWFGGNPSCLFNLTILEHCDDDYYTLLSIQVIKLVLAFGFEQLEA